MGLLEFFIRKDEKTGKIEVGVSEPPVGQVSGSNRSDFYVYEWFIVETGEIFYVGKGRGNRYKEYHTHAYEAEKIRETYETDSRFIGENLTEEEAVELETKEILRVLNETTDRLTNRIIPFFAKRSNGYDRSPHTPTLEFEKSPCLYTTEIDEHYFGAKPRAFDVVDTNNLKKVYFIEKNISKDVLDCVYGGNYHSYYDKVCEWLKEAGHSTLKTQYAKSVSAWIYSGDDDIVNYEIAQKKAVAELGRNIPVYHLIDIWHIAKNTAQNKDVEEIKVRPKHSRIPVEQIKNVDDWEKGFDEGFPFFEKGEILRKEGSIEAAILLFDKARSSGYLAPALYTSYAKAYRKLKDYDNEVAILDEGLERLSKDTTNPTVLNDWKSQREKAIKNINKQQTK